MLKNEAGYWQGFNDGKKAQTKFDIIAFIVRVERLKNVKGVGKTMYSRIMEEYEKPYTPEEQEEIQRRLKDDLYRIKE